MLGSANFSGASVTSDKSFMTPRPGEGQVSGEEDGGGRGSEEEEGGDDHSLHEGEFFMLTRFSPFTTVIYGFS